MGSDDLGLTVLESIVQNLNYNLPREYEVHCGSYEINYKKPFFWDTITETNQSSFLLYQTKENGLLSCFGLPYELKVGRLSIEKSNDNLFAEEGGETINLRIFTPLIFKNGLVVPKCNVKLIRKSQYGEIKEILRKDFSKQGFYWKKIDLTKPLPTEWFLK